jgi:hypothetical protein
MVATAAPGASEMDQAYQDELAGRISDEFRMQKSGEGQADENQPGYRERFGLIRQNVETEEWCAKGTILVTYRQGGLRIQVQTR